MEEELKDRFEHIESKIDTLLELMHGNEKGALGIMHKVEILWRILFVWPIATGSALAGCALTLIVQWLTHK